MYRQRLHVTVSDLESWNECLKLGDEFNKLAASRGWAQATFWTQTVGPFNEIVFEMEYSDLATFQRENEAFNADPDAVELSRRFDQLRTVGTGHSELWEQATTVG